MSRFGYGETGSVFVIDRRAAVSEVPGLDPRRKRIGLAVAGDGTIYAAYYEGRGERGAVSTLGLAGAERDVMPGLKKPIGVSVIGEWLFASDQETGQIARCRLPRCEGTDVFASVAGADLLASDRAGTLYVGTKDGDVYRIVAGGGSERWATGLGRVRGIAVDSAGGRVFLATKQDGRSAIRVLPLPK